MAYLNTTTATHTSIAARANAVLTAIATRYKQHRVYRQTFTELAGLSKRDLADLGISRGDIRRIAREAAQQ